MSSLFTIGKPKRVIREHITNVTNWIKDILQQTLGLHTSDDFDSTKIHIMVSEIECNAPDCVPLETFVVIFGNTETSSSSRWTGKILKPVDEVTKQDVMRLLISTDILDITIPSTLQLNDSDNIIGTTPDELNVATNTITNEPTESQSQLHELNSILQQIERHLNQVSDQVEKISQIESIELLLQSYRLKQQQTDINNAKSSLDRVASIITDTGDDDVVIVVSMVNNSANRKKNNQPSINTTYNINKNSSNNKSILPTVSSTSNTSSFGLNNSIHTMTAQSINNTNSSIQTPSNIVNSAPIYNESSIVVNKESSATATTTASATNTTSKRPFNNITTSSRITTTASSTTTSNKPRHEKGGVRPRGCPCCDPDNLDNLVDKLLFLEAMP